MAKKIKLCLVCSVGGHLTQMQTLKKFYTQHDYFYITENNPITETMKADNKVYMMPKNQRKNPLFPFILIFIFFRALMIFLTKKPDLVISTGSNIAVPVCILAKLIGAKVIFIESFAKVTSPTISGKIIYPLADLFIVQRESLLKFYPKAVLGGSIY